MDPGESEATQDVGDGRPPASPLKRLLAAIALIALLASATVTSWWILTGQSDFLGAARPEKNAASRAR